MKLRKRSVIKYLEIDSSFYTREQFQELLSESYVCKVMIQSHAGELGISFMVRLDECEGIYLKYSSDKDCYYNCVTIQGREIAVNLHCKV